MKYIQKSKDYFSLDLGGMEIIFSRLDKKHHPQIFVKFPEESRQYKIGYLQGVATLHWLAEILEENIYYDRETENQS